ncbi:MAG: TraX family protein [Tepidanaerobacteraceae bacterium]|jgi:hypothetical protein
MLELIAMITMLIDHIGAVFVPHMAVLRIIGRISFPIYCFLLVRGSSKTGNFYRYLFRLTLLALISQPIYFDLFGWKRPNVIFTLSVCLIILKLMEKPKVPHIILSLILTLILASGFEYSAYAVLLVLIYRYIKNPYNILVAHSVVNISYFFRYGWIQQFSILGSLIIALYLWGLLPKYDINRSVYRAFYPLHMLCLLIIKIYLN